MSIRHQISDLRHPIPASPHPTPPFHSSPFKTNPPPWAVPHPKMGAPRHPPLSHGLRTRHHTRPYAPRQSDPQSDHAGPQS